MTWFPDPDQRRRLKTWLLKSCCWYAREARKQMDDAKRDWLAMYAADAFRRRLAMEEDDRGRIRRVR